MGASTGGAGAWQMPTNLETVVTNYLHARAAAQGTRDGYLSTMKKWEKWGKGVAIEQLGRKEIREFLDVPRKSPKERRASGVAWGCMARTISSATLILRKI